MSANDRQVAGDHYRRKGMQHWDLMAELNANYFQGQITRYTDRHKRKAGLTDLEKARHFAQKWEEIHADINSPMVDTPERRQLVLDYCAAAGHDGHQTAVFLLTLCTPAQISASLVRSLLGFYSRQEYPATPILPGTPEDGGHHARQEDFDITPGGRVRYVGKDMPRYGGREGTIVRNNPEGQVGVRWDGMPYAKDSQDCSWHSLFDLISVPSTDAGSAA